jgi:formylglycine-generating enzyme required for sulfatase activity
MARLTALCLWVGCGGGPQESLPLGPHVSADKPNTQPMPPQPMPSQPMTIPDGLTDARPEPESCPQGMLPVPGGRFVMGQVGGEAGSDERAVHLVMVDGFCMDRTEVPKADSNLPWVGISWQAAQSACAVRGARLPTEAEWEKAARGGCELGSDPLRCDSEDGRLFPWGNEAPSCGLANHSVVGPRGPQRCESGPTSVDAHVQGAGPYGHLNMAGNVWEYVSDFYHPAVYRDSRPENPGGPNSGRYRSLRGGGWDTFSTNMRVSNRFNDHLKGSTVGFRCVKGATPVVEGIAAVEWSSVTLKVQNHDGSPLNGRWLVVSAFDVGDINPSSGLPAPGRSPLAETGVVPAGQAQLEVAIEIPKGVTVRLSAALDMGGQPGGSHPAASSGGIGWANQDYTVQDDGSTGLTVKLAPLPAHPRSPRP